MKNEIKPVLFVEDMAEIFRVSVPTVIRWEQDSRQGLSNFPLTLDTPGRRLAWNPVEVEEYMSQSPRPPNAPKRESAAKERKRNQVALADIAAKHGGKVKTL